MEHSLNTTFLYSSIVILFIFGRIIYLSTGEKYLGEKRTIVMKIKNDAAIQVLIALGLFQIILDITQYYFNDRSVKGLLLGLFTAAAVLIFRVRMRKDKNIRERVMNSWGKTNLGVRLYLIFLGLFTVYTFIKSVRDLFIS